MLVPMAKVELIGPKSRFSDVLSLLHELGTLHIEDLSKRLESERIPVDQMHVVDEQIAEKERLDNLLVRVRAVIKALRQADTEPDSAQRNRRYRETYQLHGDDLAKHVEEVLEQVEERVATLARTEGSLESDLALFGRYEPVLQKIQPLAKQIVTTGSFDSVALLFERRYKGALDALKDELDRMTRSQCEIVVTDVDEETTAAVVVFAKRYSDAVHSFLAAENVNQIRLPSEFQDMPFEVAYEQLKQRQVEVPRILAQVRADLAELSKDWYTRLSAVRDALVDKGDELEAIPKVGQTDYTFVLTGWVPADRFKEFSMSISKRFGNDIIIDRLHVDEHELTNTPVELRNPKIVAPFQKLLGLRGGLPQYGTIDPTLLLAVFYPIIFGLIVGDIAYGLIMLITVIWLRRKYADNAGVQTATAILGPAATMAIVGGFLYGEFLGDVLTVQLNIVRDVTIPFTNITLPFHRTHSDMVMPLIYIVLAIGGAHIAFGLILGIINGLRTGHRSHAFSKAGMLTLIVGAILLVLAAVPTLAAGKPVIQAMSALALLAGALLTLKYAGVMMGLVEILELVGNVASYIRIMAVGLAGAIFADAINALAIDAGLFLGGLIGLVLHSINMVVVAFSPNIHALRLNLLEFFGKFYEPSSEEYRPFKKTGGERRV